MRSHSRYAGILYVTSFHPQQHPNRSIIIIIMGISQHFQRTKATPGDSDTEATMDSTNFSSLLAVNAVLTALSITNVAFINSVIAWSVDQRHNVHSFQIEWSGSVTQLNVEPYSLWVGQCYESNAVACFGLLLGVFGMVTAWRARAGRVCFGHSDYLH